MSYKMNIAQDGILRISFVGDLDESEMISFAKDIHLYLEAATEAEPVHSIMQVNQIGRISVSARKRFIDLNRDNRFGYLACVGDNRSFRVLSKFMSKAAKRDNIRFFSEEHNALSWLNYIHSQKNHLNPSEDLTEGNHQ